MASLLRKRGSPSFHTKLMAHPLWSPQGRSCFSAAVRWHLSRVTYKTEGLLGAYSFQRVSSWSSWQGTWQSPAGLALERQLRAYISIRKHKAERHWESHGLWKPPSLSPAIHFLQGHTSREQQQLFSFKPPLSGPWVLSQVIIQPSELPPWWGDRKQPNWCVMLQELGTVHKATGSSVAAEGRKAPTG